MWLPTDGFGCPYCGCYGDAYHGGYCPDGHLIYSKKGEVTGRRHPEDPYVS